MTFNELQKRHITASSLLSKREGQRDLLLQNLQGYEKIIRTTEGRLALYESARRLLELFVKSTEHITKDYIEPVVTEALDFVFSQHLFFHLRFVNRRNQVEIDFIILRTPESEQEYQEYEKDPSKYEADLEQLVKETKNTSFNNGGAVNQVIAMVLIFVLAQLLKIEGPIWLDEPSSAVGEEYSARLGQLISSLSERFNRQYVLITHSSTVAAYADIVYRVSKINEVSTIKRELI